MAKPRTPSPFPSDDEILKYIQDTPGRVGKREIARAYKLDGAQKMELKKVLRRLADDGLLERSHKRTFTEPGALPPVTVVEVSATDIDGELLGRPMTWEFVEEPPTIYMAPTRRGQGALSIGDRVLAKLTRVEDTEDGRRSYEARTIRRLTQSAVEMLGVMRIDDKGEMRLRSTNRRHKTEFWVADTNGQELEANDLVRAEVLPGKRLGMPRVKLIEKISRSGPKSISLIAVYDYDIPTQFPEDALQDAEAAGAVELGKREDLRETPLITIDGIDARDFDDAVFAEADDKGGWHLIVAIADVSHYVRPGSPLDVEAYKRGNSVYFPDRVVPMLPEALSNGWCSLRPDEERSCLAAHMWIDADGHLKRHTFVRGLMRSAARTTYEQVQAAMDGAPDEITAPLVEDVLTPLYGAYKALLKARRNRGVLELDLPERKIELDDDGNVTGVTPRPRFDSHKLIEEFMVLANVAAAETLEKHSQPCMYRIHDVPSRDKLESLREFLSSISLPFTKGQVLGPKVFNQILDKVKGTANSHMVSQVVLRSQAQAEYNPDNIGHFGLALPKYAHFTSPIRRYCDLLVHRALIRGLKLGEGGLEADHKDFGDMGEHISQTERRATSAERDAVDRFTALYLSSQIGAILPGRVTSVTRFGLFVQLEESGGDGLIPIRTLPDDYYVHDEHRHTLTGRDSGLEFRLGDQLEVMLKEADPITGGTILTYLSGGTTGKKTPKPSHKGTKRGAKPGKPKGKSRTARRRGRHG